MAKEGGGIKNITQSGSGNAVTDMALSSDGKTITAVFGETFARQQDLGTLNNTVTQLSNKLNNFLEGSDADNIINKWKELEAFLDGLTESDNLAELLALKADKAITISAGTGLTGGGNLSANRTLSLATTGVKAGTYTKVTVDTYGRVTVGDNPTTLAGYGITDAVTLTTAQTISGRKTFSQNIVFNNNGGITYPDGNVALRNSDGHTILASFGNGEINLRPNGHNNTEGAVWINKAGNVQAPSVSTNTITIGDAQLVYDSVNKALRVKHRTDGNTVGFYSDGWITALGVKTGGSGGDGLVKNVYGFSNLGTTFSDSDLDNTFNAYTIKKLYDMAGQGGLDADAMWAELKKADSSKIIDASHIPTSVLDGRWVKKTGDTMTGTLTSASTNNAIVFKGLENCDITNFYTINGTLDSNSRLAIRNGLRFNWYDTYWYIGNLRGESTDSNGFGIANESHKLCLQVTPNNTIAPVFRSTVATGTAPFTVSSTTQVSNLNADLLDDRHGAYYQNRVCDTFVLQYNQYDYIEFLRFVIPSGQKQLRAYVVFDLCRAETGNESSGRAVLRLRRNTDNTAGTLFYVTNFGRTTLPELRCTSDDGITWRIWMKCNKSGYDPYIAVKIVEQYPYGYVTTQNNGTTGTPEGTRHVFTALSAGISNAANFLVNSRTLWGQPFNGTANVSGDMTGVGSITMSGDLKIGNGTSPNTIYFYGTTGDSPGDYNHTFIAERLWGGTESSELVLFKGNDLGNGNEAVNVNGSGPDRIRHIAAAHLFQTYTSPLAGSVEDVCTSSALKSLFGIAANRVTSYVPFMSTVASGTAPFIVVSNTVVGNLNADLLDGVHLAGLSGREGVMRSWLRGRYTTVNQYFGNGNVVTIDPKPTDDATLSANTTVLSLGDLPTRNTQLAFHYDTNTIKYRRHDDSNWNDWVVLIHSGNYASYSDGRYVKKAGDTMTGDLAMNNTKGIYITHGTRVVKTSGNWIHGGADVASSTDANLRFGSWYGIGWYPTISGMPVTQGNNAMWLDVRTGVLDVHSNITSHGGYLAANWDSARRLVLGGGSSYVWIDLRNSSNNSMLNNIVLYDSYTETSKEMRAPYFKSIVGTGTAPYQCNSTTLNSNLNADMLDNWHLNFLPRNYNIGRCYAVRFAIGGKDNGWKKIFACSESGTGPYKSVTVWGRIWYAYGSHAQSEVWNYHFCAIFYMRKGPSSSDSSVGTVENSARLYLPTFAKGMDNIRLVRVGTNNFELQVRQIGSYHNANIEYQYWSYGCNVSAWENLQPTSNTSVAVSARDASTLADSRASSADVLTTSRTLWGRPFNGSANIDGNIDNAAVITSKGGIWLDLKGSSGVAFYSGGSLCAVINNTGVGIGTSSPSQKLHVAGNIIATGAITAKASSSDIRLKTDIQGYDAMGIIRKFRSVKYHWNAIAKENSEVFNHNNWNYGLIAQDLLSGGYSQWVKDAFNDYYTIDYERLIPVVWKGLQEVDDEVTRLKKRVRELEKRLGSELLTL